MGVAMPFSKFNVDPEHIEAMREAFQRVCDILQLDCGRDDPMTELIVIKIVERAKAGEFDPELLCPGPTGDARTECGKRGDGTARAALGQPGRRAKLGPLPLSPIRPRVGADGPALRRPCTPKPRDQASKETGSHWADGSPDLRPGTVFPAFVEPPQIGGSEIARTNPVPPQVGQSI
jgi:hypothetical protein